MKTTEQKAKAYDEALEKAKEFYILCKKCGAKDTIDFLEDSFSELKSEDEKIMKAIKYGLDHVFTNNTTVFEVTKEQCLAWLEKQGEQKPADKYNIRGIKSKHAEGKLGEMIKEMKSADKVEPKFHEGEWIIRSAEGFKHNTYLVKEVKDYYACEDLKGQRVTFTLNDVHKNFKLWDISDAKPGDVLFLDLMEGKTFIYNGVNPDMAILYSFIISNDGKDVLPYRIGKPNTGIGNIEESKNIIYPATKEQRDKLEKAMADAGWEFDFEKKELKKIEQKSVDKVEPKFKVGDTIKDPYGNTYHIIEIENDSYKSDDGRFILFTNEKFYTLFNPAWSEEDEKIINKLIAVVELYYGIGDDLDKQMCLSWLKSIKDRVAWKPSEEQMKALKDLNLTGCISYAGQGQELINLYNDLKKLKC